MFTIDTRTHPGYGLGKQGDSNKFFLEILYETTVDPQGRR